MNNIYTDKPVLILVGGSNGSGKTTTANVLIATLGYRYLGADDIAKKLNPHHVESVERQAGKIFIQEISKAIANKESLIVESTLSGVTLRNHLKLARSNGYSIKIIYIFLDNVEISLKRVELRVQQGGHNVPEDAVRRRFPRSRENFWRLFRPLADFWELFYNSNNTENPETLGVEFVADGTICPLTSEESVEITDPIQFAIFLESVGEPNNAT